MKKYQALLTSQSPEYQTLLTEISDLGEGEVEIEVEYSSINYKDALAVTGKGKILKKFPLVPGIDLSGKVVNPGSSNFKKGQEVLVNGCGLGETHNGGFCERARVSKDWIIPLPSGLSTKEAMILGTAGFTAALALYRMKQLDQTPDKGPIAITGASGGVGSWATQLFSQQGFDVVAISSKKHLWDQLKKYGAQKALLPEEIQKSKRPLESAQYGGVVDNVGGDLLSQLIPQVHLWGNVASIGLADSHAFQTTVMPFILRGVSIVGASSGNCPMPLRTQIWNYLGAQWKPQFLPRWYTEMPYAFPAVPLYSVPPYR